MIAERNLLPIPHVSYLLSDLGGGTGHHLFALLESRSAHGWSADIVSEVASTVRSNPPVPVSVLRRPRFRHFPFGQTSNWIASRRLLRYRHPDILHTYFFWSIIYGRMLKAEGVVSGLVENREDMGFNWGPFEYTLLRMTRKIPDRVLCVSEAVRNVVLEKEGVSPDQLEVIRNGIRPLPLRSPGSSDALRAELKIPADSPIVGMVANFNRSVKGAVHYVDALSLVAREVANVRFLVIGLGDNQADLQARADSAGVGSQLLFTGFRRDVDRFYELMDIAALTSLSEGLSITILEAMRQGVPVVATDVGGSPEIVVDGTTGYLTPPQDIDAFAERVIQLLNNPGLRSAMGEAARKRIEQEFLLSDVANRYGKIYEKILSSRA